MRTILAPPASNTASKGLVNLVSRLRIRNRTGVSRSSSAAATVRPLGDPGRIGVPGRSGYVHPPGAELEEDQRVQRLQPDRLPQ